MSWIDMPGDDSAGTAKQLAVGSRVVRLAAKDRWLLVRTGSAVIASARDAKARHRRTGRPQRFGSGRGRWTGIAGGRAAP
ncbi:hypothetical protein [Microbispora bryophytorum]|uniref:Uncharacterized protein n=1 Tax=Microbispora bryophytorum TaxID=1460882 RepID=A0A8H9H0A3_9ACTN|nr:hypothetical protein [Microbispora bryophytorum]MBD3138758.1 hypothetical protein [Microbispora bryophytorum]TQS10036.1 hypothetical protein FLX07_03080 [Microbispora bryophytorum]GGO00077.1 hypothetical protein GCM10011574_06350 [Microbispora bryophytorum]